MLPFSTIFVVLGISDSIFDFNQAQQQVELGQEVDGLGIRVLGAGAALKAAGQWADLWV